MKKRSILSLLMMVLSLVPAFADEMPSGAPKAESEQQPTDGIPAKDREWLKSLKFQTGKISIGSVAEANVPEGYKYLNPADSSHFLEVMKNPPAKVDGMLFPDEGDWFVVLEYEKEGHVKDDDAAKINYGDLLKEMKKSAVEGNAQRISQGYVGVELVGWATAPKYDAGSHKLYWAKDLKFADSPDHTLNYNIRMLGREGVLVANAVGGIDDLEAIEKATPDILSMVDFTPGNTYADYNEKTDHTAEYGIAGLIAGAAGLKIAAKVGLLALIGKKFAIFWKPIAIAFAFIATRFKRIFGRKDKAA